MERQDRERIALHRFGVIAEATPERFSSQERGANVRVIAARIHTHPDGSERSYSRQTIDRWMRAWRKGGLAALEAAVRPFIAKHCAGCHGPEVQESELRLDLLPAERSDAGELRAHPGLFAEVAQLRLELPTRSSAQIASIVFHRHGVRISERTVREQLRRRRLHREALQAEPTVFGRYEAARPNERWVTDVLVGPFVPWPKVGSSVKAKLFLIVDDHSRLLVDGRFYAHENARACQELLRRAIVRRGEPEVLYCDNGRRSRTPG